MSMLTLETTTPVQSKTTFAGLGGYACKDKAQKTENVMLYLDDDVLDTLRAKGDDWETHFNAILRSWLQTNTPRFGT